MRELRDAPGVQLVCEQTINGLDEAVARFAYAAKLHTDLEPYLVCQRDKEGRRRWVLTVFIREGES